VTKQEDSNSLDLNDVITDRGITYESLSKVFERMSISDDERRSLKAAWLYLSDSYELDSNIAIFLRENYPRDPALQKVAEVLENHNADKVTININKTRKLYVDTLMHLKGMSISHAVELAARHFWVTEAAIWKSIKRSSTDK
jgi:hypothetical protein